MSSPIRRAASPMSCSMASGSEVSSLRVERTEQLIAVEGLRSRVVSMPSWELFDDQDAAYRDAVLPPDVTAGSRSS